MFWDVDKIRHIREEKHITRERLATMTGIPIQTLADWEQHRHSPVRVNDSAKYRIFIIICYNIGKYIILFFTSFRMYDFLFLPRLFFCGI